MQEFIQNNYYSTTNKKFVDTHRSTKIAIEFFLSKLLLHDDLKRIVYCSPEKTFRTRIEQLDTSKGFDMNKPLKQENLELPYISFFKTGETEPDDRMASATAEHALTGQYVEEFGQRVRALATKTTYKANCFFARQDDVRIASQLLLWEKEPKYPIRLYDVVRWRNKDFAIPVFLTIENINSNPEYKETDWLKENRIFTIEVEFTVRSYQLLINNVDKIIQLPVRFSNYIDNYEEDEDTGVEYFTEKVILEWAAKKFDLDIDPDEIDVNDPEYVRMTTFLNQDNPEVVEEKERLGNEYTIDILRGYFDDDANASLMSYEATESIYDKENNTYSEKISYMLKPEELENFSKIVFSIPTKEDVEVTDPNVTSIEFKNLYPNSSYPMTIMLYSKR